MATLVRKSLIVGASPFAADPMPFFNGNMAALVIANGALLSAADVAKLAGTSAGITLLPASLPGGGGAPTSMLASMCPLCTNAYSLAPADITSAVVADQVSGNLPGALKPGSGGTSPTGGPQLFAPPSGYLGFDGSSTYITLGSGVTVPATGARSRDREPAARRPAARAHVTRRCPARRSAVFGGAVVPSGGGDDGGPDRAAAV